MNRLFLIIILFATACNSQTENKSETGQPATSSGDEKLNAANLEGCYVSILNNDTSYLKIEVIESGVTGDLTYNRYQKDKNEGTIKGEIKDSLVVAYYTFESEGITSVRQVVFKPSDKGLAEGFGDIVISKTGDTASFKDISTLQFQDSVKFTKTECQ